VTNADGVVSSQGVRAAPAVAAIRAPRYVVSAWIGRHHQVRKLITVEAGNGTRITSRTEALPRPRLGQ